jgi:transcription antitermination protein NusB
MRAMTSPAEPAAPPKRQRSARRRAREFLVQGLYQWLLVGGETLDIRHSVEDLDEFNRCDGELFDLGWRAITTNHSRFSDLVAPFTDRPIADVSPIERAVLLVGTWELAERLETPYRVAINEAVELARTFGGTDGHRFVNGVLDKVAAQLRPAEFEERRNRRPSGEPTPP